MAEALDEFEVGDVVVYLDGHYWKRYAVNIVFGGYYVTLSLKRLPHAEALSDPALLDRVLGDKDYWLKRERPDRRSAEHTSELQSLMLISYAVFCLNQHNS